MRLQIAQHANGFGFTPERMGARRRETPAARLSPETKIKRQNSKKQREAAAEMTFVVAGKEPEDHHRDPGNQDWNEKFRARKYGYGRKSARLEIGRAPPNSPSDTSTQKPIRPRCPRRAKPSLYFQKKRSPSTLCPRAQQAQLHLHEVTGKEHEKVQNRNVVNQFV